MSSIIEAYKQIYNSIEIINGSIDERKAKIEQITNEKYGTFPERIKNLEEAIANVDEHLQKVRDLQIIAKRNIKSMNLLTIEAPPGYRVNLNRLRNWAMMIDPTDPDDPFAQRIYAVAKCDECFLLQKKKEFEEKLEMLKSADNEALISEVARLEREIREFEAQHKNLTSTVEFDKFVQSVIELNNKYWLTNAPSAFQNRHNDDRGFAFGAMALPLPVHPDEKNKVASELGAFFSKQEGRVFVPLEYSMDKDYILAVSCAPSRTKQLDRGIQNYLLNCIEHNEAGEQNIYVLDAARFNSSSLGSLRKIENTVAVNRIPRNSEQLTNTLEKIVSEFSDIDDVLDLHDSVREYNAIPENRDKKIPTNVIVLYGWPNSFQSKDKELVERIIANYERYGITLIAVSFATNDEGVKKLKESLPEYAANNATLIKMKNKDTTVCEPEKAERNFVWYTFGQDITDEYAEAVKSIKRTSNKKGNAYPDWFPLDKPIIAEYERDYKPISLPFGMDGKEQIFNVEFENENFATYLVGASRSGKSTLLHTLIAGLIMNYHPDNVELWLADFKQLEFARYINHCPPHVKYILLDESAELVYDLIDRLTDIMMERQHLFAKKSKKNSVQKLSELDPKELEKPAPVIFVILDEFSIMSQAISLSDQYKLKMQNLLAKGAALGIRFLFASQTFTKGISGLTSTARDQVQQRIAMKASNEEVTETLELSANTKTDQVKNWIDTIQPHYALVKSRVTTHDKITGNDEVSIAVSRLHVLYFPNYDRMDDMIDNLSASMKPVEQYNVVDNKCYVDKHPVFVDGNSFYEYDKDRFVQKIENELEVNADDYTGEETFFTLGTPRLMTSMQLNCMTNESRENMLLIAPNREIIQAASIISSMMKCYLAQGKKVTIWAYSKDKLFRKYHTAEWSSDEYLDADGNPISVVLDADDICDEIYALKQKIYQKQTSDELIVLLGIDRICADFDFSFDDDSSAEANVEKWAEEAKENAEKLIKKKAEKLRKAGAVIESQEALLKRAIQLFWVDKTVNIQKAIEKYNAANPEKAMDIKQVPFDMLKDPFDVCKKLGIEPSKGIKDVFTNKVSVEQPDEEEDNKNDKEEHQAGFYNASEDFKFVLKQGSRFGYHFLLDLSFISDLKMTGLRVDNFRHRLSFQLSKDESYDVFTNRSASQLPEHICQYSNLIDQYSFRPYIHRNINWDGWQLDDTGKAFNIFSEQEV